MEQKVINDLINIVGEDYVLAGEEQVSGYIYDDMSPRARPKANFNCVVVKPANPEEISRIMRYANENKIIVVCRGGGTGLSGACVPTHESIILSTERLNKILEIDLDNMVAVVETAVTLDDLLEELNKYDGITFPCRPGDGAAHMGGMAVCNAGGARAVRHGVTRKHIMGLEVVLPTGEIINLGGKLIKDNSGYNLMQLVVGSEGTLAIVTKVTLRVYPVEPYTATVLAPFPTFDDASNTVLEIMRKGINPLAVEYQDKWLFVGAAKMLNKKWPAEQGDADLLIVISEKTEEMLYDTLRRLNEICMENNSFDLYYAGKQEEQDELFFIRNSHWELIKDMEGLPFDLCVPVGEVPSFLKELKSIAKSYDTDVSITAHIADGNVHTGIRLVDGELPPYAREMTLKMYNACFSRGGTMTGEHGIGKVKVDDLTIQKPKAELDLMKRVKLAFDPNYILNPGTVISELA